MKNFCVGFSMRFLIHAFTDSGEALYDSSYIVVFTDLRILFLPPKLTKSNLLNLLKSMPSSLATAIANKKFEAL